MYVDIHTRDRLVMRFYLVIDRQSATLADVSNTQIKKTYCARVIIVENPGMSFKRKPIMLSRVIFYITSVEV